MEVSLHVTATLYISFSVVFSSVLSPGQLFNPVFQPIHFSVFDRCYICGNPSLALPEWMDAPMCPFSRL